jgi:hypothetical protein
VRSIAGKYCAPAEAKNCMWSGRRSHPPVKPLHGRCTRGMGVAPGETEISGERLDRVIARRPFRRLAHHVAVKIDRELVEQSYRGESGPDLSNAVSPPKPGVGAALGIVKGLRAVISQMESSILHPQPVGLDCAIGRQDHEITSLYWIGKRRQLSAHNEQRALDTIQLSATSREHSPSVLTPEMRFSSSEAPHS